MASDRFNQMLADVRRSQLELETKVVSGQKPTPAEFLQLMAQIEELLELKLEEIIQNKTLARSHKASVLLDVGSILDSLRLYRRNWIRSRAV